MSRIDDTKPFIPVRIAVLTVSDSLVTGEALPSDQRERSFGDMVEVALEAAFA